MSAPSEEIICFECGRKFDPEKQQLRTVADYTRTGEGIRCRDRPSCRGRVLHAEYKRRGLKRWARHTAEQLLTVMDLPPKGCDPDKAWTSIHTPHERVLAAVEFFSTCYPVCLLYAVQTDADGEPIKELGDWKRHTHRSLATVLHMSLSAVTRQVDYLRRRNLLTEDDGRLYAEPDPKPLGPEERAICIAELADSGRVHGESRISESDLKDLAVLKGLGILYPSTRRTLAELFKILPTVGLPNECTRIRTVALESCGRINLALSEARTRENLVVYAAINGHLSLLSRGRENQIEEDGVKVSSLVHCSGVVAAFQEPAKNPSNDGNSKAQQPVAPLTALAQSRPAATPTPTTTTKPAGADPPDPDEPLIRETVEIAWGAKLLTPDDQIPTQLLAIARRLGFPARVLQVWIGAFAAQKAKEGYPITGPGLFVLAGERDLPVWAKGNRLIVENATREANRAEALDEQRRENRLAQLAGVIADLLRGPLVGYGDLSDFDTVRPALERLAAALQGDVTEFSLYALAQLNDLDRRPAYAKLMPREFGGPRWLSVLLPLAKEFSARKQKARGAGND